MVLLLLAMLVFGTGVWMTLENASITHRQITANVKRAGAYAVTGARDQELQRSANERLLTPLIGRFAQLAIRMSPASKRLELARKIQNAGSSISPHSLLAVKGGLVVGGLASTMVGLLGGGVAFVALGGFGFVGGFLGPDMWLNRRGRSRREQMERMLPDTLDLLTVSVEAGLGFDSAVAKVCEKMQGPLIDELSIMSHEIRVGSTRRQALRNMGDRVGSEDLASFARAIIQAEELGTSLGRTLKVQADDMRVHRQLAAEERAMKAPVKMLFPTVLFIFPAMFIVILGPAALNIMDSFKNM